MPVHLYEPPTSFREAGVGAPSPWVLDVQEAFAHDDLSELAALQAEAFDIRVVTAAHSIWAVVGWPSGARVAFRLAYSYNGKVRDLEGTEHADGIELRFRSPIGPVRTQFRVPDLKQPLVRWTTWLKPEHETQIGLWPRDIYPLGPDGDPMQTRGIVHVQQFGLQTPLIYVTLTQPHPGSFLYVQNATALNPYCDLSGTSPADCIGSQWPELGYRVPMTQDPLPAVADDAGGKKGQEVVISEAIVHLTPEAPGDDLESARLFMDLLADIYLQLPRPETGYRDWIGRVDDTLRDLTGADEIAKVVDGQRYFLAYLGHREMPPESMVQLSVLLPITDYMDWSDRELPIVDDLKATLPQFYNPEVGSVVRWLPGQEIPTDEEHMGHDIMDSWYLYHVFLNLSRLAATGDEQARKLFLDSVEFAVRVGQHFDYRWPVLFNLRTLEAIKAEAEPGAGGENDVGALYAQVMLQAHLLTEDRWYIEEAERAAQKLVGLGFKLAYQFNNTTFGAGAMLRLWRETGKEVYRDLSYVCLANTFARCWLWDCRYGHAKHGVFFGLPPLTNAPYLAPYEETEALAAFMEYLAIAEGDIPDSVRLLVSEYPKYAIDRGWFYYPSWLPDESLAMEPKSGHLDRALAIPVEDLYDGWQKAGQVGQEVYGAAAPFIYVTRSYHRVPGAPLMLFCDYPVHDADPPEKTRVINQESGRFTFKLAGDGRVEAKVRAIPMGAAPLATVELRAGPDEPDTLVHGQHTAEGHVEYRVPGSSRVALEWKLP
ncbi:MAG: hypothetical protein ACOYEW_05845 [Anaerolineae bacterium]|jgi:hypothetical protein